MTDITHIIAEIEKAMAAATPGSWFVSGVRNKIDGGHYHQINRYDAEKKQDENIALAGYDPRTGLGFADAKYIAACNPSNIADILSRLKEAEDLLKPFAENAKEWAKYSDTEALAEDWPDATENQCALRVGHLRAAARFLKESANADQ